MKAIYCILLSGLLAIMASCDNGDKGSSRFLTLTVASQIQEKTDVEETPSYEYIYYIKQQDSDDWAAFPHKIIGFSYEAGFEYVIKIKETEIKNPAQDQDPYRYQFIELISKTEKESEGLPF